MAGETNITLRGSSRIPQAAACNREFLQMMVNRCVVGFHRYGPFYLVGRHSRSDKAPIARLKECLKKYERTGNRELLVDISNYAQAEFTSPHHPRAHFKCLDQGAGETV